MEPFEPRYTAGLFRPLLTELMLLLRTLEPAQWDLPTVAGRWRVRDVVAHLLDGDLRKLAICRDRYQIGTGGPITSDRDLSRLVNGLNATGVEFAERLSEQLLIDLVEITGGWVADYVATLPPHAPATFAVSWAGEMESENWMDIGREFTERWHHQMQIRDAAGRSRLLGSIWMEPLIEFSLRALPKAYHAQLAPAGTAITLEVTGETSGAWTLQREGTAWRLWRGRPAQPSSVVVVTADDVWRLFYNALSDEAIDARVIVRGDRTLAAPLLSARSVIL
jgi:uncharacterized protein (TIGR03083 family)